jgi:hypothetical protein
MEHAALLQGTKRKDKTPASERPAATTALRYCSHRLGTPEPVQNEETEQNLTKPQGAETLNSDLTKLIRGRDLAIVLSVYRSQHFQFLSLGDSILCNKSETQEIPEPHNGL